MWWIVGVIVAGMIVTSVLVVAASMNSSRISRRQERLEVLERLKEFTNEES